MQYFKDAKLYPQIAFLRTFTVKEDTTINGTLRAVAANFNRLIRTGQDVELSLQASEPTQWQITAIANDEDQGYLLKSQAGPNPIFLEAPAGEDTVVMVVVNGNLPTNTFFYNYKLQVQLVSQQRLVNVLEKPFPNPFRFGRESAIVVPFRLRQRTRVEAVILREDGRVVYHQKFGELGAGPHFVQWNGVDESGKRVGSGVYFLRLLAGDFQETTKFVVIH